VTLLELKHFSIPARPDNLVGLLNDSSREPTESYGQHVDLNAVSDLATSQIHNRSNRVSAWDGELGPVLHQALKGLPRHLLLDMALWDWLAITRFRDWIVHRWLGGVLPEEGGPIKTAQVERFIGRPTLHGFAHHSVARLFWGASALYAANADDGGYEYFKTVFAHQDFQAQLFERKFSLCASVPPVCAVALKSFGEAQRRKKLKRLNFLASTIALEALDADGVAALLAMD
jgi:hypothetical protein